MILALFVKRKKRNIFLCIYRENGKDGAFYMIIMTAMRIIRIIMIMAVILTMKTIMPMMIQRITMTLPERSSLQLPLLSQWV